MRNLAKHEPNTHQLEESDRTIQRELTRCGISIKEVDRTKGEVQYTHIGELNGFTFYRAWSYWVVEGLLPLELAKELYAHPVGRTDIRVEGHCGCPDPEKYNPLAVNDKGQIMVTPQFFEKEMKTIMNHPELQQRYSAHVIPTPGAESLPKFVTSYHIDTELGLYLFAEKIKNLTPHPGAAAYLKYKL